MAEYPHSRVHGGLYAYFLRRRKKWIEVLSSEDRPVRVNRKVRDVIAFGSKYVWVIDPDSLESYVVTRDSQYELADGVFRIAELGVEVPLGQLEEED